MVHRIFQTGKDGHKINKQKLQGKKILSSSTFPREQRNKTNDVQLNDSSAM